MKTFKNLSEWCENDLKAAAGYGIPAVVRPKYSSQTHFIFAYL